VPLASFIHPKLFCWSAKTGRITTPCRTQTNEWQHIWTSLPLAVNCDPNKTYYPLTLASSTTHCRRSGITVPPPSFFEADYHNHLARRARMKHRLTPQQTLWLIDIKGVFCVWAEGSKNPVWTRHDEGKKFWERMFCRFFYFYRFGDFTVWYSILVFVMLNNSAILFIASGCSGRVTSLEFSLPSLSLSLSLLILIKLLTCFSFYWCPAFQHGLYKCTCTQHSCILS